MTHQSIITSLKLKGRKRTIPSRIRPMLATLIQKPFDNSNWLFEIKWDGYRAIAKINKGKVALRSRNNLSFNEKFPTVIEALRQIKNSVILDGEIVALDKNGQSRFQLLQDYQNSGQGTIIYYVFDILYLDGFDLKNLPLIERKNILKNLLPQSSVIRYSDHILSRGKEFFAIAKHNHLEGIMAKEINSEYEEHKRSKKWVKIKTYLRQEAVIGGFTKPRGSRKDFGALVLGVYKNNDLKYIGHTGSGFDTMKLDTIMNKLKPLITEKSPFKKTPKTNTLVTWVKPKLICEVTFLEWTHDGNMRQPVFIGLRDDKKPKDVKKEIFEKVTQEN